MNSSTDRPAGRVAAIIPAAGAGLRMGGRVPKQFLEIAGKPLLALTLETFERCEAVDSVFLVVPGKDARYCRREIVEGFGFRKVAGVVPGGAVRRESVRRGISAASGGFDILVVHDGVRPLVTSGLVESVIEAARASGAATAGVPARDTVKWVEQGMVTKTCDREKVWLAQTPQAFRRDVLADAHDRAERGGWDDATDDASLVERIGFPVAMVPGDEANIKVTTPGDAALVRFLVRERAGLEGS